MQSETDGIAVESDQTNEFHGLVNGCPRTIPQQPYTIVTEITKFLCKLQILCCSKFKGCSRQLICVTIVHLYLLMILAHTIFYILELGFGYASVGRDASIGTLKDIVYNSRYTFMVLKSAIIMVSFRMRSCSILAVAENVVKELYIWPVDTRRTVSRVTLTLVCILLIFALSWEVMEFIRWETEFLETWMLPVTLSMIGQKIPLWRLLAAWYTLATPINILMNVCMIYYASIVLSIYLSWKSVNRLIKRQGKQYIFDGFEADWERLRNLAESADDTFAICVFVAWVADIACAVGYLGSVVIYGGGRPIEQAYTILGLFIHAIWNPACYLIPCILFHEEMAQTQRLVISATQNGDQPERYNGSFQDMILHSSLILQKVAYRPEAFTAWKFFFVTRNMILTISTVLVSYALVLVQLVGRKQDVQGVVNLINEKMNYSGSF
ncbi:uncharacterized protein LOC129602833 [Paramacrobiotus metropolitanus]|uniref:uncharacterized protein LOC129602833 n=1 Tax=Paramacrobiotus metropolitanus TaxID=2943436 RepID=UPI002445987F|nr:uncharacterized protein LOC129602833 [Paramacrobiotus metropolitanus]